MTEKEKQLLLQDLSARLPYGVFCVGITYELDDDGERYIPVKVKDTLTEIHNYKLETASVRLGLISSCKLETVKPYLRPLSSMTEEDNISLSKYVGCSIRAKYGEIYFPNIEDNTLNKWKKVFDWLNAHHFDYCTDDEGKTLIEKMIAIRITEDNNPYKD